VGDRRDRAVPTLITNAAPAAPWQLACGAWHTLLLSQNGSVWRCGDKQAADGAADALLPRPAPLPPAVRWAGLGAGSSAGHSLALSGAGDAHVWGSNTRGQSCLGASAAAYVRAPADVRAPAVVAACAGQAHTLLLMRPGTAGARGLPPRQSSTPVGVVDGGRELSVTGLAAEDAGDGTSLPESLQPVRGLRYRGYEPVK